MALSRSFVLVTDDRDKVHIEPHPEDPGRISVRRAGSRSPAFSLSHADTQQLIDALGDFL